jgi:hypothetical protein
MKPTHKPTVDPLNGNTISEILAALPNQFSTPTVTIAALSDALSGRAYGMLMLVLALPNLIPIPAPGLSAIVGAPLIFVTLQMMLGLKSPWFPNFIGKRKLKTEQLRRVCNRVVPVMEKLELLTSPRLKFLAKPPVDRFIALICVALSLMIMMPIPFGNALPALAICLFSIGILQRDGLFVIAGLTVILLGTAAISAFMSEILDWIF